MRARAARARRGRRPLRSAALVAGCAGAFVATVLAAPLADVVGRPLAMLDASAGLPHYEAVCAGCHGYVGEGLTGAIPPLAGVVPRLLALDDGREYLIAVVLHGLSGRIEVAGRGYDGIMPSFGHVPDRDIASVLNHVATAWGNREMLPAAEPEFTALEVALARSVVTDQSQLNQVREALTRTLEQ